MTPHEKRRPVDLLLVEDSPTDVLMAREALAQSGLEHRLHVVPDGAEALRFLRREGRHADAPRPALVLLDLNMPRMDGREFLDQMKSDPALLSIPAIVLTTSTSEDDVGRSYQGHANAYMVKDIDFTRFIERMRALKAFWFDSATLPPAG
jgi:CheY-like chemotaxis protein